MELNAFKIVLGIAVLVGNGYSENISPCIGIDDGVCVNIPNNTMYDQLRLHCSKAVTQLSGSMKSYGNDLMRNAAIMQNSRCIHYHKIYSHGGEESQEMCMPRQQAEAYCPHQFINEPSTRYKLKACVMCGPAPVPIGNAAIKLVQNSMYIPVATLIVNLRFF